MKKVVIIGAGPAGLMAAEVLSQSPGLVVSVYDAMPSAGRKFLQAGRGGLNITHSKPLDEFVQTYGERQSEIEPWVRAFPPQAIRDWVQGFGIVTFVGSSGRVYPQDMKAAPLLRAWLHRLREQGVTFHMRHKWQGWDAQQALRFARAEGEKRVGVDITILALGGASWPHLGSDGQWTAFFDAQQLSEFQPANCGFNQAWSSVMVERFAGQPLKNVVLNVQADGQLFSRRGECLITRHGLEGSLVYALSKPIREALHHNCDLKVALDLMPDLSETELLQKLNKPQGKLSISNFLKRAGLDSLRIGLLREKLSSEQLKNRALLAQTLKGYCLDFSAPRPIEEAISSAGGLKFEAFNTNSELITRPGVYCLGEMLDWEAPTGGYLLTAVLAQARFVAQRILAAYEAGSSSSSSNL
jgi:hypothetical protein